MGKKPAAKTKPATTAEAKIKGDAAKAYVESLVQKKRMLIVLRDELYEGSWESMLEDLHERLSGRPYIFKLVNRIEEDIEWVRELRDEEQKFGVNLATVM